jgi:nucleoside-diphosphate-sugar epimerase
MQTHGKIAVAGATGRAGRHVVDVLGERGYQVVPISRSSGVDVITGDGLAEALAGVQCVIDTATGPSPEQEAATEMKELGAYFDGPEIGSVSLEAITPPPRWSLQ